MMRTSVLMDHYQRKRQQEKLDPQLFVATLEGVKTPEQILLEQEQAQHLERLIDRLQPRTGLALRLHYGIRCEPMTYEQVSQVFGVTRGRIRQITAKGERILRRWMLREENPRRWREVEARETEAWREGRQAREQAERRALYTAVAETPAPVFLDTFPDIYFPLARAMREPKPGAYEAARDDFYRRQRLLTGGLDA
jgi:Sigma-70, region 4